jgi:hypothetical protein
MGFVPGELVQYKNDPNRLAIVIEINKTSRKAHVCEVVIVYDKTYPQTVGEKRYTHVDYWKKIS